MNTFVEVSRWQCFSRETFEFEDSQISFPGREIEALHSCARKMCSPPARRLSRISGKSDFRLSSRPLLQRLSPEAAVRECVSQVSSLPRLHVPATPKFCHQLETMEKGPFSGGRPRRGSRGAQSGQWAERIVGKKRRWGTSTRLTFESGTVLRRLSE